MIQKKQVWRKKKNIYIYIFFIRMVHYKIKHNIMHIVFIFSFSHYLKSSAHKKLDYVYSNKDVCMYYTVSYFFIYQI
jgi:hypothetical protein